MSHTHDYKDRKFDKSVYDESYYEGDGSKSGYRSYMDAKGIVRDQYAIFNKILSKKFMHTPTVFDIGTAYGFGIAYLYEHGWTGKGIDVSTYAIKRAKELHPNIPFVDEDIVSYEPSKGELFDVAIATELFEHIDTGDVEMVLDNISQIAKWGVFVINARTSPDQPLDSNHGDHGHLNNHSMSWWIETIAGYGELDYDAMFEFSKMAEAYNREVHWHNRCIVVKFN